jgi:hypothetical protein
MLKEYAIELAVFARVSIEDEENSFIQEYEIQVLGVDIESDSEKKLNVGEAKITRILLEEAINRHENIFGVLDATPQEIANICFLVVNPNTGEFEDAIAQLFGELFTRSDILILNRIQIRREFRGKKVGLIVLSRLIQVFGAGCGLVLMKPFPLQFENRPYKPSKSDFKGTFSACQKKLIEYYSPLGFQRIPRSDVFCLNLNWQYPDPKALGWTDSIFIEADDTAEGTRNEASSSRNRDR